MFDRAGTIVRTIMGMILAGYTPYRFRWKPTFYFQLPAKIIKPSPLVHAIHIGTTTYDRWQWHPTQAGKAVASCLSFFSILVFAIKYVQRNYEDE